MACSVSSPSQHSCAVNVAHAFSQTMRAQTPCVSTALKTRALLSLLPSLPFLGRDGCGIPWLCGDDGDELRAVL